MIIMRYTFLIIYILCIMKTQTETNRNVLNIFLHVILKFYELNRIVSICSFVEVATYSYKLLSQGNT
ncbi:hypothetical protein CHD54_09215 [Salmonella enterica]|nr:hypothetical protein CHD54_09215 [Salmonella enterica]